jgi:hypothetical protein
MPAPMGHPNYASPDNLGGRPKKYTDEYIEEQAEALLEWMKQPGSIYVNRFALNQGYSRQRLVEFSEQNKRFADVYNLAKEYQETILSEGATLKTFSEGFCKFALINHHGWKDKTETKISGDSQDPLAIALQSITCSKDLIKDGEK